MAQFVTSTRKERLTKDAHDTRWLLEAKLVVMRNHWNLWNYWKYDWKKSVRNCCTKLDSVRTIHQMNPAAVVPLIGLSKSCYEHGHSNLYNRIFIVPQSVT